MASIFTEHVRHFRSDRDAAESVLPALERLLKQRMRRKNLLSAPPAFLGYKDVTGWSAAGAFDDIRIDCYVFAVLTRLVGLQNQLLTRDNIDGMIVRNVDRFLIERQRRHDPIGYALFQNVEGAVRAAVAMRKLCIDGAAEGRLHGSSVLRLDRKSPTAELAEPIRLREALVGAHGWSEALPALIGVTEEGQEWVGGFLERLAASDVAAVRCSDLIAVLANRARGDWASRHTTPDHDLAYEGEDELGALVRLVGPDSSFEERDRWEDAKRRIPEGIARLDRQQRVRDRLAAVFQALIQAIEEGGAEPPSQALLIERLGVARSTLSDDFRLLREVVEEWIAGNPEG